MHITKSTLFQLNKMLTGLHIYIIPSLQMYVFSWQEAYTDICMRCCNISIFLHGSAPFLRKLLFLIYPFNINTFSQIFLFNHTFKMVEHTWRQRAVEIWANMRISLGRTRWRAHLIVQTYLSSTIMYGNEETKEGSCRMVIQLSLPKARIPESCKNCVKVWDTDHYYYSRTHKTQKWEIQII